MSEFEKIVCPVCNTGKIEVSRALKRKQNKVSKDAIGKRLCIQILYANQYSIREIMNLLDYKSTASVWSVIQELNLSK